MSRSNAAKHCRPIIILTFFSRWQPRPWTHRWGRGPPIAFCRPSRSSGLDRRRKSSGTARRNSAGRVPVFRSQRMEYKIALEHYRIIDKTTW